MMTTNEMIWIWPMMWVWPTLGVLLLGLLVGLTSKLVKN
jgi:hypothetical protein